MRQSLRPEPLWSVWLMFAVRAEHAITQTDRQTCAPIYTLSDGFSIPSTMGKAEITSYTDCCPTPSVDMLGGACKSSSSHGTGQTAHPCHGAELPLASDPQPGSPAPQPRTRGSHPSAQQAGSLGRRGFPCAPARAQQRLIQNNVEFLCLKENIARRVKLNRQLFVFGLISIFLFKAL